MDKAQRIDQAKKRIQELNLLIKHWEKSNENSKGSENSDKGKNFSL